jgi:hypothetical protein
MNTTGADFIVAYLGSYKDYTSSGLTDNKGNSYTGVLQAGASGILKFYYCIGASCESDHTFTIGGIYGYWDEIVVMAFSGGGSATYHGETSQNPQYHYVDTMQPGSITPSVNGSLIVSAVSNYSTGGSPTCNSGFTYFGTAKNNYTGMMGAGYLIQETAAAINPTWSTANIGGSGNTGCGIADFAPS